LFGTDFVLASMRVAALATRTDAGSSFFSTLGYGSVAAGVYSFGTNVNKSGLLTGGVIVQPTSLSLGR